MIFGQQELLQIDDDFIHRLHCKPDALVTLSIKLASDLKEAHERLNQNPSNSSVSSGSMAPWDKGEPDADKNNEVDTESSEKTEASPSHDPEVTEPPEDNTTTDDNVPANPNPDDTESKRKPGKQPGTQGMGRTQELPVTNTVDHVCGSCSACHTNLSDSEKAYTGFYTLDVVFGHDTTPGLMVTNTLHRYYSAVCLVCGLDNRTKPFRAPAPGDESDWKAVGLTEWRLVGPSLVSLIVYLSMNQRMTRRKLKEFLSDVLGISLSTGCIQNGLSESARALAPVEEQLLDDLVGDDLLHGDETSHNESGNLLWLWVFLTATTAVCRIGKRTKDLANEILDNPNRVFSGWLMSDGYGVYRSFLKRLRCWAHLIRKAKGLKESYTTVSREFGEKVLEIMDQLMEAIYQAREGPSAGRESIKENSEGLLVRLRILCDSMKDANHDKTRALAREFLNDWEAIFRVLDYPAWPLTNNIAEQMLRPWVLLRRITQGTSSAKGSRALALFASVITTCRLREASSLLYIKEVVEQRRQGKDVPDLPLIPNQKTVCI